MPTLPEKFQKLLATVEPTKRGVPLPAGMKLPKPKGGHYYHEAAFFGVSGIQVQCAVIDGKEAPSLDETTVALLADLMYVINDKGEKLRPERPDTPIDCPNGHGKLKRVAALNVALQVRLEDGRVVYASFPIIDVPTCLSCGAAALDEECQNEIEARAKTVLNPAETTTMFCIFQNPNERPGMFSVAKRVLGKNIDVLDPKDVIYFATLDLARAAVPKGATLMPPAPNEIPNFLEGWMIETAKIPVPKPAYLYH